MVESCQKSLSGLRRRLTDAQTAILYRRIGEEAGANRVRLRPGVAVACEKISLVDKAQGISIPPHGIARPAKPLTGILSARAHGHSGLTHPFPILSPFRTPAPLDCGVFGHS